MGSESEPTRVMNNDALKEVVRKIVTTFFTANVPYKRNLDVYGSIHVRSDDTDFICCVFNEHCHKPDRRTSLMQERDSMPLIPGSISGQQGTSASNAPSSANEYLPDWMGQTVGGGSGGAGGRFGGKRSQVTVEQGKEDAMGCAAADDQQSKKKKTPGLSRKLSKLNRGAMNLQYPPQSVFPEPLTFGEGGKNAENQKFQMNTSAEIKHGCSADESQGNEGSDGLKLRHKSDGHGNSMDDDDGTMAMASSDVETPMKGGMRLDHAADGDLVDLDSGDSHDFDPPSEKVPGLFPFGGSQQSFNHSTPSFSTFSLPSVSFNDAEMFSQASWMPPPADAANSRQANQMSCASAESSFDAGSTKGIGPLSSEKICVYCLKIFHSNLEMSQHIQQEHNSGFPLLENTEERPYRPRYQNAYAYGGSELDVDRQLTCSVCSLSFRSLDGLRCHENSKHSRNKLYKCQFCTQSFLTRQAAYTHRMKFHRLIPRKPQLLAGPMTPI